MFISLISITIKYSCISMNLICSFNSNGDRSATESRATAGGVDPKKKETKRNETKDDTRPGKSDRWSSRAANLMSRLRISIKSGRSPFRPRPLDTTPLDLIRLRLMELRAKSGGPVVGQLSKTAIKVKLGQWLVAFGSS